ncbi:acetate/propionate family kinase [Georgenia thermotolerans]|uniref:Acetate kinase n=1 Tax=Georgenia thermotolerans TaxID=527326 RepID=A0A7J5ULG8_9MICO|nr:acetate kinase [Georgenia thermotolerans]KAE8763202.1 acetate/propionate family kinase [Georgenia thermotolerans]
MSASRTVLVINSGSSSIKYQLVDPDAGTALASGLVERIGESAGHIEHRNDGEVTERHDRVLDHGDGLRQVLELFQEVGPDLAEAGIVAVGHRVVQGGRRFAGPALVDDDVVATIERLSPLAPLHNPANLRGIQVGRMLLPDVPHVVVFDTAFFQGLPDDAATYALDREVAERYSVRRYGAHGTSHQYVSAKVSELLGRDDLRQIVLHLGNGASASAVVGGRAVDTSMGLTPLEGLVMGTRTGDIDPATVFHLARNAGMSVDEIDDLFNKRSGLKGLTGENDLRQVHRLIEEGDAAAKLGLDVYTHRLRKYVGAYAAVMGGLDALAFTAGVGENDDVVRAGAVAGLGFLGIELDPEKNAQRSKEPRVISADGSRVTVLVVPTNEELAIARQAMSLL